jgi:signal transduction histidine kinase
MLERIRTAAARLGTWPRLHSRTVRLRLSALYGALFLLCGAGLLTVTYVLMSKTTSSSGCFADFNGLSVCTTGTPPADSPRHGSISMGSHPVPRALAPHELAALAAREHTHVLHQLLLRCGIALAIMAAVSIALGWVVAGRVLRPLRKITQAAQDISATNLHARLGLAGPNDELKELGDTIDGLLARLEAAFDAQRRFVANASHELRTPLTVMRALLQMTLTDPAATLETFRATCEDALAEGERQARLIDALLVLARSERGLDHREPLDLATVADSVVLGLAGNAEHPEIDVQTSLAPAPTEGDARLVERLLTNLVDNAVRHNTPGGIVEVVTGTRAGGAFLGVANSGPPIPAADLARLFLPFQRRDADSSDTDEGLGLGLSIVQAIADAHGATIAAWPRPAGGLHMEITFAVAAPTDARPVVGTVRDRQPVG